MQFHLFHIKYLTTVRLTFALSISLFSLLSATTIAHADCISVHEDHPPCGGAVGHCTKNSDGSPGGFVADTAVIETKIRLEFRNYRPLFYKVNKPYLAETASICGEAKVKQHARILDFAEISENATILGNAEISDQAKVNGKALVFGDAQIAGSAKISEKASIYGDARIYEEAQVNGQSQVYGNALVHGSAKVKNYARVYDNAEIFDYSLIQGSAHVYGKAKVYGHARVFMASHIFLSAEVFDYAMIFGDTWIYGNAKVFGHAEVFDHARVSGQSQISEWTRIGGRRHIRNDIISELDPIRLATEPNLDVEDEVEPEAHLVSEDEQESRSEREIAPNPETLNNENPPELPDSENILPPLLPGQSEWDELPPE